MYLLPIYFCLTSFILLLIIGKHLSSKGSVFLNVLSILTSLLISVFIYFEVCWFHANCYIHLFSWILVSNIEISWSFLYDSLSCTMLLIILLVSFCANLYSVEYMLYESHKIRFFSYLSLFTFTMIMLVISNTFIQLFFGWEGVGISSYLLINFWYTRIQANKSSILAVMANKVGDIFLLFACLYVLFLYNSVYFSVVFLCCDYYISYISTIYYSIISYNSTGYLLNYNNELVFILIKDTFININNYINYNTVVYTSKCVCFFIIFASICKSAQAGFHFWLAEAMEGPTPVSSLLHAATMVTAGIFLTVRCSFIFNNSSYVPIYIICIGSITSFFSSLIGLTQSDLKKIVAYSTCSQLGYMFLSNGIFSYNYTMFHLFNHAFFKALLFLTSGYIIHILSNEQDLRRMGGLIKVLPLPYICIFIGSISLMGVPFLSGFFSKDTIIENFYSIYISYDLGIEYYIVIFFSQLLLSISVIFTIIYSIKLLYYVFLNTYSGFFLYISYIHFSSVYTIAPLLLLSILSIISGFFFSDMMIGTGSLFWNTSINMSFFSYDKVLPFFCSNMSHFFFVLLPYDFNKFTYYYIFINTIYFSTLSIVLLTNHNVFTYFYSMGISTYSNILFNNINKKFLFFNRILVNTILKFFLYTSFNTTYKLVDRQLLEVLGPFGIITSLKYLFIRVGSFSTGLVYHYTGIMVIILFVLLFLSCNFIYFYI